MNSDKTWYAVYTKPRWEKKVADLFGKKEIEHFCPMNKVTRQWADRKKTILEPVFSSYVFVHVTTAEQLAVKQTEGVLNFVYWLGIPASILDEEIEAIRFLLGESSTISFEKMDIVPTSRVRITQGPFVDWVGHVTEVNKKTVKIYLPSLGFRISAEVAMNRVEVVKFLHSGIPVQQPGKVADFK